MDKAVSEFLTETRYAKKIAEDIVHIEEDKIHLDQFLEQQEGKIAEELSKKDSSKEEVKILLKRFLKELKELQNQANDLKHLVKSKGPPQDKEKFRKAEKTLKEAEVFADNTKSEGYSRRDILKAGAAAGLTSGTASYLAGKSQTDETSKTYPRGVQAADQIFREYLNRIEELENQKEYDLNLPIAVGERHAPPGNSFPTLFRLMKSMNTNKIGFEFLVRRDPRIREFNEGNIPAPEFADYYLNNNGGWRRIRRQVIRVFEYARENNIQIVGLEYTSNQDRYTENFLERAEKMVDIVENVNDGKSIFLAGSTHVDARMSITSQLLKSAHPEIAKNITVEEAVENPYIRRRFDSNIGIPNEASLSNTNQAATMNKLEDVYTMVGRVNSMNSLMSTHAGSERHKLSNSLEWLEETAIDEYEIIKKRVKQAHSIINGIKGKSSNGYYKTVSKSGYPVVMEQTPSSVGN